MTKTLVRNLVLALGVCVLTTHPTKADNAALVSELAPALDTAVISEAVAAVKCAQSNGIGQSASRLAIIDYTIPSRQQRLWVVDLSNRKLLFKEHVAHGQGSGGDIPVGFSDREGSHQTSLGLFLTKATYQGSNGYSLRLQGLTKGFNESAMRRFIVMHGASYVDPVTANAQGLLGRSWGCPAVRAEIAESMIDALKLGQFIYAYGPGTKHLLTCKKEKLSLTDNALIQFASM
ncbi:MAG: murein L,D-transpeptidase catalytic domain family protein [Halioglobus sp.]|nr:murein L,D-transpeptidase catalytic domain family protein [Halioglobus sp.]